jgi:hypothetical protein
MKTFVVAMLAAMLLLPARRATAEERIALVIGNGAYRAGAALANPAADARDVAAALRQLGFSVTLLTDAGLAPMEEALLGFRAALAVRPGAVALFYFAGHGIQSQGANYLLPVDQDVRTEQMLKRMAISAQDVLEYLEEARTRVNLVFLDACRTNPFAAQFRSASRGLAVTGAAPPETLVVYSTAAGDVAEDGTGRNSPFMTALLGRIAAPGIDVETMLREVTKDVQSLTGTRQTPYRYSSLTAGFAFAPAGAAVAAPLPQPSTAPVVQTPTTPAEGAVATAIRVERGAIVWGGERYTSDFVSGYESFLREVETRGPTTGDVVARISAYRQRRLWTGVLRVFGVGMVAATGILASQAEQPLGDTERTSLYLGIGVGVTLFSGSFLLAPGVPTKVVDAYNAQFAK